MHIVITHLAPCAFRSAFVALVVFPKAHLCPSQRTPIHDSTQLTMPSSPLLPGNDDDPPPTTPQAADESSMSMSPVDCCTLAKILDHVHIPPSSAATSTSEKSESPVSFDAFEGESSGSGSEDDMQYTKAPFAHGEETEDGYEDEDGSMQLSDGVEEDHNADIQARRTSLEQTVNTERLLQERIYPPMASGFEYFDLRHRRASRRFSPALISRRVSEDPLPSSSFPCLPSEPSVVPSPGGTHLEFTSAATIRDTPFARTLKHFKQYAGKENSPSKSRRNASLPHEIAELLAQNAEELEEEEEEDLEKYCEVDLAPMEPVMENATAGDLILLSTPSKSWDPCLLEMEGTSPPGVNHARETDEKILGKEVTRFRQPSVVTEKEHSDSNLLVHLDKIDDKNAGIFDKTSNRKRIQSADSIQHPTFVKVISLLPQAMFWATAAPIVKLGDKAYDAMVEKLSGTLM
ncbi:hypothetical protein BKA63DRAFT_559154 [Paraphoma chrysanthemicola]|nr:hypothetical protein BKA63DRAFT_559154 [Paraphoma chrysanthemicola]